MESLELKDPASGRQHKITLSVTKSAPAFTLYTLRYTPKQRLRRTVLFVIMYAYGLPLMCHLSPSEPHRNLIGISSESDKEISMG